MEDKLKDKYIATFISYLGLIITFGYIVISNM